MPGIQQYTYWSMTINNPTENDYVLVRNPNDKYIRQFVWTPEEGDEKGTPHIQAWIRLQRNQSYRFMGKLFPRGIFKHCEKDEYNENVHSYAQKNDTTTRGAHVITLNDPFPDSVQVILRLLREWNHPLTAMELVRGNDMDGYFKNEKLAYEYLRKQLVCLENQAVVEKPYLAKFFVSPVYEKTLKRFWKQFLTHIYDKQDGQQEDHDGAEQGTEGDASGSDGGGSQGDEDSASETDEGYSESSGDQSDEENATSEC